MNGDRDMIMVYGTTWCPDCKRAKQFLSDQRVQYDWVNIEEDADAMAFVIEINKGRRIIPVVLFPDGDALAEPTNAELAEKLGLQTRATWGFYDVIIVGGGPAGLTAAIYTARDARSTLIMERGSLGGQASVTRILDNFPGFDEGISGSEFARRLSNQARRFGAELLEAQEVVGVSREGRYLCATTASGDQYGAEAVLLATGSRYRRLNVPGEEELIGINVHFCATCDAAFYKDGDLLVIGGGNSGFQESLFLTQFARKVTIVHSRPEVTASRILQEKVERRPDISVVTNHLVREFKVQDGKLGGVRVEDRDTGETREWYPDGVFVFIGMSPNSGFLPDEIERNDQGFITTDDRLMTSMQGVFAAGDVRAGSTKQAAAAAGEGTTAALTIRHYFKGL